MDASFHNKIPSKKRHRRAKNPLITKKELLDTLHTRNILDEIEIVYDPQGKMSDSPIGLAEENLEEYYLSSLEEIDKKYYASLKKSEEENLALQRALEKQQDLYKKQLPEEEQLAEEEQFEEVYYKEPDLSSLENKTPSSLGDKQRWEFEAACRRIKNTLEQLANEMEKKGSAAATSKQKEENEHTVSASKASEHSDYFNIDDAARQVTPFEANIKGKKRDQERWLRRQEHSFIEKALMNKSEKLTPAEAEKTRKKIFAQLKRSKKIGKNTQWYEATVESSRTRCEPHLNHEQIKIDLISQLTALFEKLGIESPNLDSKATSQKPDAQNRKAHAPLFSSRKQTPPVFVKDQHPKTGAKKNKSTLASNKTNHSTSRKAKPSSLEKIVETPTIEPPPPRRVFYVNGR